MTEEMSFADAVRIVTADQNENVQDGEELFTEEEALMHVRNIMSLDDVWDYGDSNTQAYRIVLTQPYRS